MNRFGGYQDQPLLPELYDFIPSYAERRDVEFYVDLARRAKGKVLELGCGTGRILIPTAAAGCQVVGLDLATNMLTKCREKVARQPRKVQERVRLAQGDMVNFNLGETFSLITTPFRPFQHLLSLEEQLGCLRSVNRHLEEGEKLVLDVFQPDFQRLTDPKFKQETEEFPEVELPDGRRLRRTSRIVAFHRAEQYNEVELTYYVTHRDGRRERWAQRFPFRYFFRYEVEHLLARGGFRVVELFGDFDRSPLRDDSPEMIFVAEKLESPAERRRVGS